MKRKPSDTIILRERRQKKMKEVRQRYAKFGDEVVRVMMHYALQPKGLSRLVQRLPMSGRPKGTQHGHTRIVEFIQERGVDSFLSAVKSGSDRKPKRVSGSSQRISKPHSSPEPPKALEIEPASKRQAVHADRRSGKYIFRGKERRRFPRERTDVRASVSITPSEKTSSSLEDVRALVSITPSEKTSSSLEFEGVIQDISIVGLCLVVPNLPRSVYTMLCQSQGYVLVSARLPGNETLSQITGTIVWIDFRSKAPEPFCRMGVLIDLTSEKTNKEMKTAVDFLKSRSGTGP